MIIGAFGAVGTNPLTPTGDEVIKECDYEIF